MANKNAGALTVFTEAFDNANDGIVSWNNSASAQDKLQLLRPDRITGGATNVLDHCTGDGIVVDTTGFQAAVDAAENGALIIPPSTSILIEGTIYLGNVVIIGLDKATSIIKIVSDSGWTQNGAGNRKSEAAILLKSGTNAGYAGIDSTTGVSTYLQNLTITFTNTADAQAIKTAFLAEYWKTGGMDNVKIKSVSCTATSSTNVFDSYKGGQDLLFTRCQFDNRDINTGASALEGGTWVRSIDASIISKDVRFVGCEFYNSTTDECVGVYNALGIAGGCRNISFDGCYVYSDGAVGSTAGGLSIRNAVGPVAEEDFTFSVRNTDIVVDNGKQSAFGLRTQNCSGTADNVQATIRDVIAGATGAYGFWDGGWDGARARPVFKNCRVLADGVFTNDILTGFTGDAIVEDCYSNSINSGNIFKLFNDQEGDVIRGEFKGTDNMAADNVKRIRGSILHGPIINCWDMKDVTQEFDADVFTTETGINMTADIDDRLVWDNIVINVSGSVSDITKMVNINNPVFVSIDGVSVVGTTTNITTSSRPITCTNHTLIHKFRDVKIDDGTTVTAYPDDCYVVNQYDAADIGPGWKGITFDDSAQRDITAMDASAFPGRFAVHNRSRSGTSAHAVTLTTGTWNGTHTIATTNAKDEYLIVDFDETGAGTVIANSGVVLS